MRAQVTYMRRGDETTAPPCPIGRCPKCRCKRVTFFAATTRFRSGWQCQKCGHFTSRADAELVTEATGEGATTRL